MKTNSSNPKVSIIVPMYNVEQYLDQCIQSIIAQTLNEIEIILIDDGSPDCCGEKADQYAKKDGRIKVIHQKNLGLGPARNTGIEAAAGEYIGFVDSDDWVKPQMFEQLYTNAVKNNADIVSGGNQEYKYGKVTKTIEHPLAGEVFTNLQKIEKIRKNFYGHSQDDPTVEAFPMAVWIAIYKRDIIMQSGVRFKEILSEDTIFNLSIYKYAKAISFIDRTDYCYRKEERQSITQSFSENIIYRYRDFLLELFRLAEEENDNECKARVQRMAIDTCRFYVRLVGKSQDSFKQKKEYIRRLVAMEEVKECWKDYPINKLPMQQRIFQGQILKEHYGIALLLDKLRQKAKD